MRPDYDIADFSALLLSGTRLQTPTLIGCSLLKNLALTVLLSAADPCSAKTAILTCFSNDCQDSVKHLVFFSRSPHIAASSFCFALICEKLSL
jgi:hypothetical protein